MSREQANYLLGELGAQHGIAEVGLDESDFCCLALDDGIVLNLEYFAADDALVVSSLLGELVHKPREQLFATLLKANFFWRETGGGTLALDDEVDAPFLQFQLPLHDLEVAGFEAALGRMLEEITAWRTRIATFEHAAPAAPGAAGPMLDPGLRA